MKITRLAAATAVAALMAAGSASALSLNYNGSYVGSAVVKGGAPTVNANAGAFKMTDNNAGPGSMGTFAAWCLDLAAYIGDVPNPYNYNVTTTPFTSTSGSIAGAIGQIKALFNTGYATALDNAVNSAGFQVALWNAVYDGDNSASAGTFQATSTTSGVITAANTYLSNALLWDNIENYSLTYLESSDNPRKQNLVTAAPAPVPLPAAGLMLLGALGGLAAMRRRRKAA